VKVTTLLLVEEYVNVPNTVPGPETVWVIKVSETLETLVNPLNGIFIEVIVVFAGVYILYAYAPVPGPH
jgi:hypothetical protein